MKTILYLVSDKKFNRVFGHFPERSDVRQIMLIAYRCDESKFLIKDVRKLQKNANKKEFNKFASEAICDINPDVLVQTSLVDFAQDYKGKRVFVSHGIAHPHLFNPRIDKFDLFCIGNEEMREDLLNIPKDKVLRNSMPQFDLLTSCKQDSTTFCKTILYVPSVVSNSRVIDVRPDTIFRNIINLVDSAEKNSWQIKLSFKATSYKDTLNSSKLSGQVNKALQSKNMYVIGSSGDTIYNHYSSADIILIDTLVTTVITESHILKKPLVLYNHKMSLEDIVNNPKQFGDKSILPPKKDFTLLGDGLAHERVYQAILKIIDAD